MSQFETKKNEAQLSLWKTRYSPYSFCCSTDFQNYPKSMIFMLFFMSFLLVITG